MPLQQAIVSILSEASDLWRAPGKTLAILVEPLLHQYCDGRRRERAYQRGEPEPIDPYGGTRSGKLSVRSDDERGLLCGVDEGLRYRVTLELSRYVRKRQDNGVRVVRLQ